MNTNNYLSGKVCLVTGASSGIGLMTALDLATRGAHTFIACRSKANATAAIDLIRQRSNNPNVEYLPLDLSSLESINNCVNSFKERNLPLHILINNAEILFGKGLTHEGFNKIVGINYLGHFLLTYLLLEKLKESQSSRIVMVSSEKAYEVNSINWRLFFSGTEYIHFRRLANSLKVYSFSKFCMLLLMTELTKQLQKETVTINAVYPGFVGSSISAFHRWSNRLGWGLNPEEGARSSLFCAISPALEGISGKVFGSKEQELALPELAKDESLARELWKRSLILVEQSATTTVVPVQPKYSSEDGIWGPFKLHKSSEDIETITNTIQHYVLPRPPVKLLFRSLLQSLMKLQLVPSMFSLLQFILGHYYMERHLDSKLVLSLCQDPCLLNTLKNFLGDNFLLWRSEIWVNKPGQQMITFWHQDRYSKFLKGSGKSINVYIALTEVNELNGMEYIPDAFVDNGSVNLVEQENAAIRFAGNSQLIVPENIERKAAAVNLNPGEFVLFNDQLVHRSIENRGSKDRVALTLRIVQDTIEVLPGFSPIYAKPVMLTSQD